MREHSLKNKIRMSEVGRTCKYLRKSINNQLMRTSWAQIPIDKRPPGKSWFRYIIGKDTQRIGTEQSK